MGFLKQMLYSLVASKVQRMMHRHPHQSYGYHRPRRFHGHYRHHGHYKRFHGHYRHHGHYRRRFW